MCWTCAIFLHVSLENPLLQDCTGHNGTSQPGWFFIPSIKLLVYSSKAWKTIFYLFHLFSELTTITNMNLLWEWANSHYSLHVSLLLFACFVNRLHNCFLALWVVLQTETNHFRIGLKTNLRPGQSSRRGAAAGQRGRRGAAVISRALAQPHIRNGSRNKARWSAHFLTAYKMIRLWVIPCGAYTYKKPITVSIL